MDELELVMLAKNIGIYHDLTFNGINIDRICEALFKVAEMETRA